MAANNTADAKTSFSVTETMSEPEAMAALEQLAYVIRQEADAATAMVSDGDPTGVLQRRADELEDLVGELENITVDVDTVCPTCGGSGESECPTCGGSGEAQGDAIGARAALQVTDDVAQAFGRISH